MSGKPIAQGVELVQSWLEAVEVRLGKRLIVYTRRGFVTLELPNSSPLFGSARESVKVLNWRGFLKPRASGFRRWVCDHGLWV